MKPLCLLLGLVIAFSASPSFAKKVYKYTDSTGKIHYSDAPVDGAEEITLPPIQTYSAPHEAQALENTTDPEQTLKEIPIEYQMVITQPEEDFVVPNGMEAVEAKVYVEPELRTDHFLQLMMDEKPVGPPSKNLEYKLTEELTRGEHELKALVVEKGRGKPKVISESPSVTFYVNRPIVPVGSPFRAN